MQDLRTTDATQETVLVGHADYAAPTRQHDLDHTRWGNRSALKDLDHQVGIDDLSEMFPRTHVTIQSLL